MSIGAGCAYEGWGTDLYPYCIMSNYSSVCHLQALVKDLNPDSLIEASPAIPRTLNKSALSCMEIGRT